MHHGDVHATEDHGGLVVVAAHLPGGSERWDLVCGGLGAAVLPALAARRDTVRWIGWDTGVGPPPPQRIPIDRVPVLDPPDVLRQAEAGLIGAALWPLYHDGIVAERFDDESWRAYEQVNARLADEVVRTIPLGGTAWVHDLTLQLVPRMLRARRPDLRIVYCLHASAPPPRLFGRLPWGREIVAGILGSDRIVLQTTDDVRDLGEIARAADVQQVGPDLVVDGRRVRLVTAPSSVDASHLGRLARRRDVATRATNVRRHLGAPRTVLLAIDRLDPTSGAERHLRAFRTLLETGRLDPTKCVLLQVAIPSVGELSDHIRRRERLERLVAEINGDHARLGAPAVHYVHRDLDEVEAAALYRAADVLLVSSCRDGMSLVAKEFVACRFDVSGVLVLSEFSGAASELAHGLLVNPFDERALADQLLRAVHLPEAEARARMTALRACVMRDDALAWGTRCLDGLDQVPASGDIVRSHPGPAHAEAVSALVSS